MENLKINIYSNLGFVLQGDDVLFIIKRRRSIDKSGRFVIIMADPDERIVDVLGELTPDISLSHFIKENQERIAEKVDYYLNFCDPVKKDIY